jgi:tetratricopeptide (TPR) repeat protein
VGKRLVLTFVLVLGAVGCRRQATPPPAPEPIAAKIPVDAGPSDDEVFAASMARIAQLKREAEEAEVAARRPADAGPSLEPALAAAPPRGNGGTGTAESLSQFAALSLDEAVERVHALFREHSALAVPALVHVCKSAEKRALTGDAAGAERALARLREVPTGDTAVRAALSHLAGRLALVSSKAAQYEKARNQARMALELEDTNPLAFLVLGELAFQANDLGVAMDTWERGLRLNPDDLALGARLERARVELAKVGGLERLSSEHFVVSFDGRADVPAARSTLEVMEAAYRQVGGLFQQFPDGPIPLVLYPNNSFADQGHASWSAGVYDGKIRLPAEGAGQTLAFRGTLFHEYAHALFHRSTRGATGPAWLNEGLADIARLRGDPGPALLCQPSTHSFPLRTLHAGFGRLDRRTAHYAYLEARHALERLIERHGEEGIRNLLAAMSTEPDFSRAFERAFGEDYDSFARAFDAEGR